jgi:hypothetical protein
MSKLYSPPSRNYPQELPDRWRFEDGTVRTDLQELSDAELEALGWHGPITMPEDIEGTLYYTHDYIWNRETLSFVVVEVDEYTKQRRVNYKQFWNSLVNGVDIEFTDENGELTFVNSGGIAYQKIKNTAKVSLEVNVIATEFIALLSDAKSGDADAEKIQEVLLEILSTISFTAEELAEIQQAFTESGMFAVYTLA